jgi:hypothetical protein
LNRVRRPLPPLEVVVLFEDELSALIGPGRTIYVTRGLLHRAWWPEAAAMAVAHEMAHHDLGHTRVFAERLRWLRQMPGALLLHVMQRAAGRWLNGPETESEADALGLDLCLRAGYDGRRCIELFDVMETYALDHGDVETALGLEELTELFPHAGSPQERPGAVARLRLWLHERMSGYAAVRARKAALVRQLVSFPPSQGRGGPLRQK